MKVLVVSESWPHSQHTQVSANIVIHELARHLTTAAGVELVFLRLLVSGADNNEREEQQGREALSAIGVKALPPMVITNLEGVTVRPVPRIRPGPAYFYPFLQHRQAANQIVADIGADAVFIPWSEKATVLFAEVKALKFAYYGDPEPKIMDIRSRSPFNVRQHVLRRLFSWVRRRQFERCHIREMRKYDFFAEVAANDVIYYKKRGVSQAFYLRMTHADRLGGRWERERDLVEQRDPSVIVANLGSQTSTGNTLGLQYLAEEMLDPLAKLMKGTSYEVHLLGTGQPISIVSSKLNRPEVKNRGFVKDVDMVLLEASVFVCCNNATRYKCNQSRYLHVWALGGCIVAHRDAALSMPELVHGETALLGRNGADMAQLVRMAIDDKSLRRRIGRNGYACFRKLFHPSIVAGEIISKLKAAA